MGSGVFIGDQRSATPPFQGVVPHAALPKYWGFPLKGGGALCAGNAVALLVFGPVMP